MKSIYISILLIFTLHVSSYSQETLPIYTDYLTDNIFLIHPSAAGISDYGKIRMTSRKQWLDYSNAPELQTLSFHMHLGNNSAIGAVLFNDKIGHFSKKGGQISYAYHIGLNDVSSHQLSFGISLILLQNALDGRDFNLQDSDVSNIQISKKYFNVDASIAYRNKGFFSFYTIKNLALTKRDLFDNTIEDSNLRRHLINIGYYFNEENEDASIKFQPSMMLQYIEKTEELFLDANLKVFVPFRNGEVWGGFSYRRDIDNNAIEKSNYATPFLGVKYKNFMVSYNYTKQVNSIVFTSGEFHQITLGYNFFIQKYRKATWDL